MHFRAKWEKVFCFIRLYSWRNFLVNFSYFSKCKEGVNNGQNLVNIVSEPSSKSQMKAMFIRTTYLFRAPLLWLILSPWLLVSTAVFLWLQHIWGWISTSSPFPSCSHCVAIGSSFFAYNWQLHTVFRKLVRKLLLINP